MSRKKIGIPQYQKVAIDIAGKIVDGTYVVGERIYTRSKIAGNYGVSSETARKAMCILSDLQIVDAKKGAGVIVKSFEKARDYLDTMIEIRTLNSIETSLNHCMEKQIENLHQMKEDIQELKSRIEYFRHGNQYTPYSVEISKTCDKVGLSISELNFWQNTGATITALWHEDEVLVSPGPYAKFEVGDRIFFVGNIDSPARVEKFLNLKPLV